MRGKLLVLGSVLAAGAAVGNAFYQKKQFYEAIVYLNQSSLSMMCLFWFGTTAAFLVAKLFQVMFFGKLLPREVEELQEQSWFAITETCLAMTIFRDDFSTGFAISFALLLAMKMYHFLAKFRVEFMEQTRNLSILFHTRMLLVFVLLMAMDIYMVNAAAKAVMAEGISMQLLFGFEYAVLCAKIASCFIKYLLQVADLRSEEPWENKITYTLYLNLLSDFIQLLIYVCFFIILVNFYTIPLHIIRDLIHSFRSFMRRVHDLIQMRRVTANMDRRYPDATAEELANADSTCIVCRDEMTSAKKLPCGHMFHIRCLREWLSENQTCPTCRANILQLETENRVREQAQAAEAPQPPQQQQMPQVHPQWPWPTPPPGMAVPPPAAGAPPPGTPAAAAATPAATPHVAQTPPQAPGTPLPFEFPVTPGGPLPFPPPHAMFPPMMPPPMFIPFDFAAIPVDEDLPQLSDDELRAMEGAERESVMARVVFLRRFRAQLDMMLARFGQYENVTRVAGAAGAAASTAPEAAGVPTPDAGAANSTSVNSAAAVAGASSAAATPAASRQAAAEAKPATPPPAEEQPIPDADASVALPSAEQLRLRRVRHFSERSTSSQAEDE